MLRQMVAASRARVAGRDAGNYCRVNTHSLVARNFEEMKFS
jgi:hypothetical protein